MSIFSERLVEARNERGMAQNKLAELLKITPTRLNYWEKGKREPNVLMIKNITKILNVSADYLIGNDEFVEFPDFARVLIEKYNKLDEYGKEMVDTTLNLELKRLKNDKSNNEPPTFHVAARGNSHLEIKPKGTLEEIIKEIKDD